MINPGEKPLAHYRVAIIGLGLMGGSLALDLQGKVKQLVAIDINPATRKLIRQRGIAQAVYAAPEIGLRPGDLVVLATPVRVTLDILARLPTIRPEGCLVMDLGSTKQQVVAAMDGLPPQFAALGGHPMCGREASGFQAAQAGLYRDRLFLLCRSQRTSATMEAAGKALIAALGARPRIVKAADHDELVAAVSHLPYLMSALLLKTAAQSGTAAWEVSATGFRDAGRLAGSDPRMMLDILLTNRQAIRRQLRDLADNLRQLEAMLATMESEDLELWLQAINRQYSDYREIADPDEGKEV